MVAISNPGRSLAALTAAAMALPGMIPKVQAESAAEKIQADFQYSRYEEGDDRIEVDVYYGALKIPVGSRLELSANWIEDTWSGASPVLSVPASTPIVLSGASQLVITDNSNPVTDRRPVQIMSSASPSETRRQQDLQASYFFDDVTMEVAGGQSSEPDWDSNFFSVDTRWEVNQKLTTLALGLGYVTDEIRPTTRDFEEHKSDRIVQLGVTQILDKRSLVQSNLSFTDSAGFLSHPYKKVFIQDVGVIFDSRPDHRRQWAWANRYVRHVGATDGAIHLDYRFYFDTWGISSHTVEASWRQTLGQGWVLTPRFRYYSQSQADFYAPFFLKPNADGDHSSDFRLSGFGAISAGLSVKKDLFDRLSLEAGFEYYEHRADLKLGGTTESDFADFNFFLVNAALRLRF